MTDLRLFCLGLALPGLFSCALSHDRSRRDRETTPDEDGAVSTDGTDSDEAWESDEAADDEPDSDDLAPSCAGSLPERDPWLVAQDTRQVQLGPCGELAYLTSDGVHLLDATFERELAAAESEGPLQFSPDGALFMAELLDESALLHDLADDRRLDVPAQPVGFVMRDASWSGGLAAQEARSVPVLCDRSGIAVLVDDVLHTRIENDGCVLGDWDAFRFEQWSTHGARVMTVDPQQRRRVVDLATQSELALDFGGPRGSPGSEPLDLLHLSADGRLLLHVAAWVEPGFDTIHNYSDGTATVFHLASGTTTQVSASIADTATEVPAIEGRPGSHRMAVQAASELTLLSASGALRTRVVAGVEALSLLEGRPEALARSSSDGAIELLHFGRDKRTRVSATSEAGESWEAPSALVSRGGSAVAYVAFRPDRCAAEPSLREHCDGEVHETVVWSRDRGELAAHLALSRPELLWVGDDGSVLFEASLLDGDGTARYLMGPHGELYARWSEQVAQLVPLRSGFVAVLAGSDVRSLVRFDQAAGSTHSLATQPASVPAGATLTAWVDRSEQRLVYAFAWRDEAASRQRTELYAGRLR